jgi:hypothetical protein
MHRLLEVSPSVVAQRLCDLLLSFPAAAAGGVQWCVLARKYEERHGACLDIKGIGHSCALSAATALLWDVLRLVDSEDSDNPIVAVEDAVALTPRPGALGSWPSLYKALCTIVLAHGSEDAVEGQSHCLLFSQLKPLLEVHWHANFDETSIGFLSEDGAFVRLKKMKHLIQGLIRWRDSRVEWRQSTGAAPTPVDDVMLPQLELATSKKHNDLILRYVPSKSTANISSEPALKTAARGAPASCSRQESPPDGAFDKSSVSNPEYVPEPCEFDIAETPKKAELSPRTIELESLRAENAKLRLLLQKAGDCTCHAANCDAVCRQEKTPTRWADIYDDPYEPPPDMNTFQKLRLPQYSDLSPTCGSTNGGSDWSSPSLSSCGTPLSMHSGLAQCFAIHSGYGTPQPLTPRLDSEIHSGAMTPGVMSQASPSAPSVGQQVCALVPMWVSLVGDRCVIPGGIVEKFKAKFEPAGGSQLGLPQAGEALNAGWDNCYVHS